MLKLNVKPELLPWIVMGLGGASFLVGSILSILLKTLISSDIPFVSFILIYFLQIVIGLILLDVLFNKGKNIVNMIITSLLIGLAYLAFLIVSFPILTFLTYSNLGMGTMIGKSFNTIILMSMTVIAGAVFTLMMLNRKMFWKNVLICLLISIPSGIILPILTQQNAQYIAETFIIIYGVTIGLGIGFISGLYLKSSALR